MTTRSKLAVILRADIVDSTRLVQQDGSVAHVRFQDAFRRLSDVVATFGGITHERRGDALVAEFDRASDAVCAALSLDPDFAGGYAGVSAMLGFGAMFDHADPTSRVSRAVDLAKKAIEVDDTFGWSYTALAVALLHRGEHEEAITSGRKAIERQPNDADAYSWLALILGLSGQPAEGVVTIVVTMAHAIRLNPLFVNGPYLNMRSVIQVVGREYEDAILTHEQNIRRQGPIGVPALAFAASALAALRRMDDAHAKAADLKERFPGLRLSGWNLLALLRHPEDQKRIHELMVAAGVPG